MSYPGSNESTQAPLEVYRGIIYDESKSMILFVRRSLHDNHLPGYYEFPGGKVDPGEAGAIALRREVEEETGLVIEPLLGDLEKSIIYTDRSWIKFGKHRGLLHVSHFVVSRVVDGDLNLSLEHDDCVWDQPMSAPTRTPITPKSEEALRIFQSQWALANAK